MAGLPPNWSALKELAPKPKLWPYMRLTSGMMHQFRIIGSPTTGFVHFDKTDGRLKATYYQKPSTSSTGIRPRHYGPSGEDLKERRIYPVIDRASGTIKVLNVPPSVFERFDAFTKMTGLDAWSPSSPDFIVAVVGQAMQTRYEVSALPSAAPLTQAEQDLIAQEGMPNIPQMVWPEGSFLTPEDQSLETFIQEWMTVQV